MPLGPDKLLERGCPFPGTRTRLGAPRVQGMRELIESDRSLGRLVRRGR